MSKSIKAFTSMVLVILCLVTSICLPVAYAAEPTENVVVRENEMVDDQNTKIKIEELDPNIKIIVTEITEDSNVPMPLDLRRTDTYFDFTGGMQGKGRYYAGNHFSVDMKTSSEGSGNFTLSLVRTSGIFEKTVGKVELPTNGSFHVEFLNVYQPDWYRFDFNQVGWGSYHQSGTMTIWDWD